LLLDLARDRLAGSPIDPDQYCPECWKGGARPAACPHCGSLVCAECGSILESAAELGLG